MIVVNIVDTLAPLNFGVWNAALFTSKILKRDYDVSSRLWAPQEPQWDGSNYCFDDVQELRSTSHSDLESLLAKSKLDPAQTIIATHGAWTFCTRWGHQLKRRGFRWVTSPQGMLEPWSLQQKPIRKRIYRMLFEDRMLRGSDMIRAVSNPELTNLSKMYPRHPNIQLIPNGVDIESRCDLSNKTGKTVLFLGRLHEKKAVAELVEAWASLSNQLANKFELRIVGPDQGEQQKIEAIIARARLKNVKLLGPLFGETKTQELLRADFFALPSHSEGFPTSVLEAMSFGCFPIISPGCNFPEASEAELAINVTPAVEDIRNGLLQAIEMSGKTLKEKQQSAADLIRNHYSTQAIAAQQFTAFESLISGRHSSS